MSLTLSSAPAAAALDWAADIRPGLRLDSDDEKAWVEQLLVPAVSSWAETITGRALITQTWALKMPCFPGSGRITIPKPPLQSITSITYVDADGVTQTWDASLWTNDAPSGDRAAHAHVWPAYGESYPTSRGEPDDVTITFVCGYGDAYTDVPSALRLAMLLVLADRFEHREAAVAGVSIQAVPMGAEYQALSFLAEAA